MDKLDEVAEGIEYLIMWVRRQAPTSVSTSTITTLDTLGSRGPQRISDLAEHEAISQPGMTALVNRLEQAGQAERIPDPTDGRAILVRITAAGRAVLLDRQTRRAATLRGHLDALAPQHRRALIAALPAIRALVARPGTPREQGEQ